MADYWTENGLIKPQQIVVCAAIKVGNVLLCGARHCDSVMWAQADAAGISMKDSSQGFIDQFGDFLTREGAMQIVKQNGQPFDIDRNRGDSVLFSEGLY
jgi:hypothetical protein